LLDLFKTGVDEEYQKRIGLFITSNYYSTSTSSYRVGKEDDKKLKIKYVEDIVDVVKGKYDWYSSTTMVKQMNGSYMRPSFGNAKLTGKIHKVSAKTSLK
jgi:hypothetical protein